MSEDVSGWIEVCVCVSVMNVFKITPFTFLHELMNF